MYCQAGPPKDQPPILLFETLERDTRWQIQLPDCVAPLYIISAPPYPTTGLACLPRSESAPALWALASSSSPRSCRSSTNIPSQLRFSVTSKWPEAEASRDAVCAAPCGSWPTGCVCLLRPAAALHSSSSFVYILTRRHSTTKPALCEITLRPVSYSNLATTHSSITIAVAPKVCSVA
jgi:hypothetical protein